MGMQLSGHCLALCYCRLEVGDTLNEGRERGRKRNSEHVPCSASSLAGIYDLYIVLKGYPLIGSTWSAAPKPFSSLAIWGSHFHFRTHPCNDSLRGPSRPSLAVIFEVGCDREPGWLHLMSLGWLPDSLTGIEDVLWVKQPQWLSFFCTEPTRRPLSPLGYPVFRPTALLISPSKVSSRRFGRDLHWDAQHSACGMSFTWQFWTVWAVFTSKYRCLIQAGDSSPPCGRMAEWLSFF